MLWGGVCPASQGPGLHYLTGSEQAAGYLEGRICLEELLEEWRVQAKEFEAVTEDIRIYR